MVNEAERRLLTDVRSFLGDVVPDEGWRHDEIDEDTVTSPRSCRALVRFAHEDADSHLRALLCGSSETLPARDGWLDFGTWQSVLLVECDGPRSRTVELLG